MTNSSIQLPTLHTILSPSLLDFYDLRGSVVVVIDVLRATSTIATALYHGAKEIIPVDGVSECIRLGKEIEAITAGERDGQIAEGLQYGNTPIQYTREFIEGKTLVLTTTNGTRLLHRALKAQPHQVVTGAFCNLSKVSDYLANQPKNIILACAAWRDKVNLEDTLFAGAVVSRIKENFDVHCDASSMAEALYQLGKEDLFQFMKDQNASHYHRLTRFGFEEDIRYCLSEDKAPVLPIYKDGSLMVKKSMAAFE